MESRFSPCLRTYLKVWHKQLIFSNDEFTVS